MVSQTGPIFYSDDQYEIRPAKNTDEFRDVWWGFMQVLGWNRGYYDLDSYMNPSNGYGMILLIEKASGKPVGHVAAVINDNSTGWVSMFIIDENHRGKGLGRELFKAAEQDFERKGIKYKGLDGVVEQRATYERRKFVSSPLGTIRIMIRPLVSKEPVPEPEPPAGAQLLDICSIPQNVLAQFETGYTGFDRPKQWSDTHMFNRPDVKGVAIASSTNPQSIQDLRAWALTRRCSGGIRIGPVYASDAASARAILLAAMQLGSPQAIKEVSLPKEAMNEWSENEIVEKATLVTEVWGGNAESVRLFHDLGWQAAGVEYYRMWVDGVAPEEQSEGGSSQKGVYAIFDAATG